MAIKYQNRSNTMVWADRGTKLLTSLYLTLCQFHNSLEVEFLPVHHPTEEEVASPGREQGEAIWSHDHSVWLQSCLQRMLGERCHRLQESQHLTTHLRISWCAERLSSWVCLSAVASSPSPPSTENSSKLPSGTSVFAYIIWGLVILVRQ